MRVEKESTTIIISAKESKEREQAIQKRVDQIRAQMAAIESEYDKEKFSAHEPKSVGST